MPYEWMFLFVWPKSKLIKNSWLKTIIFIKTIEGSIQVKCQTAREGWMCQNRENV